MAVYVATIDEKGVYRYSLAGRRGVLLEEVESAFLAEALALECGLEFLISVLEGTIT